MRTTLDKAHLSIFHLPINHITQDNKTYQSHPPSHILVRGDGEGLLDHSVLRYTLKPSGSSNLLLFPPNHKPITTPCREDVLALSQCIRRSTLSKKKTHQVRQRLGSGTGRASLPPPCRPVTYQLKIRTILIDVTVNVCLSRTCDGLWTS